MKIELIAAGAYIKLVSNRELLPFVMLDQYNYVNGIPHRMCYTKKYGIYFLRVSEIPYYSELVFGEEIYQVDRDNILSKGKLINIPDYIKETYPNIDYNNPIDPLDRWPYSPF